MSKRNLATIDTDMFTPIGRLLQQAMAHGITNDLIFGGLEPGQTALQGINSVGQLVKNCAIATRRVTPDGRVFRYSLSAERCDTFIANCFYGRIGTDSGSVGIDWSALAATSLAGATSVTMTNQGGKTIAENALVGGTIVMNPSDGTNNSTIQMRRITGNTAATLSGICVISFAEPLIRTLTVNVAHAYCMPSPYSSVVAAQHTLISGGAYGYQGFCGYAGGEVSTSSLYHWEQTWGMIAASLYGNVLGVTRHFREVVFRYDGNLMVRGATTLGLEGQTAGFILDNNSTANGATMIMLQVDR